MDPFYAFLTFAVLLVLEYLASQFWLKPYFLFGIPVFSASGRLVSLTDPSQAASALGEAFKGSPLHPTLQFKSIGDPQTAVREVLFEPRAGVRYLPVMHGLIRHNPANQTFRITGYLNWSILAAILYLAYRITNDQTFIPVAILIVVILVISYSTQAALYNRIGGHLAGNFTHDHARK